MENAKQNFQQLIEQVAYQLVSYIKSSQDGEMKVLRQKSITTLAQEMKLEQYIRHGGLNTESIESFLTTFLDNSQHMHHPQYMGHQVATPHWGSTLADLIHGAINNPMNIYEMGPSTATIEQTVINWMLQKIGWYPHDSLDNFTDRGGSGLITHGGSLANLTALLAARAKAAPDGWEQGVNNDLVVLGSEVSHYSTARAVSIMGLGKQALWSAKVDDHEVLKPESLQPLYQRAIHEGKSIMAVVANACATSTGLYDPLDEMADFCEENNLWFHVDGAHGASALLSDRHRGLLRGIERADSVVWDAHKMLRTSALLAAVLFKDEKAVGQIFQQKGSYLYYEKENPGIDAMPHTLECTKSGIATKLFWVLATEGEKSLADFVTNQYDKTFQFYQYINSQTDFECAYTPESNILCFDYLPCKGNNELQLEIAKHIVERGHFYITSAEVNGRRLLRFSLMNPLTETEHIRGLIEEIRYVFTEMQTGKVKGS